MSILRVANLQFNASGTRRIDYDAVADDGIINISADAVKLPVGDNATRPSSEAGMIRFNSDTGYMEFGGSTDWVSVASNAAHDAANAAFNMANVAYNAQNVDYTLSNTAFSVANAAFGFSNTVNTFAYGVAVNAAAAFAAANNVGPQLAPAFDTANAAYGKANTALANTSGVSTAGDLYISGSLGVGNNTPVAKLQISAANTVGGVGYADFLRVTNASYPGITTPVKTFRLNQSGNIEIINSAYSAVIASLDDSGNLIVGSRGINRGSMPAGSILQVQQAFYSAATTLASSTFTDYPGLSITITPSSSTSKFMLMYHLQMTLYGTTIMSRFVRNGSAVGVGDAAGSRNQSTTGWLFPSGDSNHQAAPMVGFYLDSPATSSAITYKVQAKTQTSGTAYINYAASNADNSDWAHRSTSSFTIFEVAV